MNKQDKNRAKQAAAKAAADLVQSGMLVGIGTGSTAAYFIDYLIDRCRQEQLNIHAFPTSEKSAKQALAGGIPLCDPNEVTTLDLTIDGADEVDHQKRMIKGGGGALLREKISASMSREMVVIIDPEKLVDTLGHFPLPVEIIPFAHLATLHKMRQLGYAPQLRMSQENVPFLTDNGNYIADIRFPHGCQDPEQHDTTLRSIVGVVTTGFFLNLAGRVLIGKADGTVQIF